jgi:serine/threonine protein phosphatase PrpC
MSADGGNKIYALSRDHKPTDEIEEKRIVENGGNIYQTQTLAKIPFLGGVGIRSEYLLGPHRVLPGRLSVSRTFGDIEAKLKKYGGNPNVVVAIPDIKAFRIQKEHDFIVLG